MKKVETAFRLIYELVPDPVFLMRLDGTILNASPLSLRRYGFENTDFLGKNIAELEFLPPDAKRAIKQNLARRLRGKKISSYEISLHTKKGEEQFFEVNSSPIRHGDETLGIVVFRDVTILKQTEQVFRETKREWLEIFSSLDDLVLLIDTEYNITQVNKAVAKLLKKPMTEIIGQKCYKLIHDRNEPITNCPAARCLKTVDVETQEYYEPELNKHFLIKATPILDKENKVMAISTVLRDITGYKQAEERLQHLNLVLYALRELNRLIVREKKRDRLLKGACDSLVKTRGYHNTWITLLGESGEFWTHAEAGLGKDFLPIVEQLKRGKLTECGRRALVQPEVIVIKDPASTCTDCPLASQYAGRGAMTIRLEHAGKVYGLLCASVPRALIADKEEQNLLEDISRDIALALHSIELKQKREEAEEQLKKDYETMVVSLAIALEARDPYTKGHSDRVKRYCRALARQMGLPTKQIQELERAALLHDIGKIAIPDAILSKPGALTPPEFAQIQQHPEKSIDLIRLLPNPPNTLLAIRHHHERTNGKGYPDGLSNDDIPLEARVLAVADAYDALTSDRPYRTAFTHEETLRIFKENAGIQWDAKIVEVAIEALGKGF